jgi:stearoyl-CoA desaturase (delta-9 desaturase)
VVRNEHGLGASVINRAAEQLAAHFNAERIADSIASALQGSELTALRERLARAHDRTAEVLATVHLPQMPHMPSREELTAKAKAMFAKTKSLEEIADRAYEMLLASVGTKLAGAIEGRS